jgi:hypothetical protein
MAVKTTLVDNGPGRVSMFSHNFIDRPRLAAVVVSVIITLAGLIATFTIPVEESDATQRNCI